MEDVADFSALVAELALDAVRTQRLWNDAHHLESSQFVQLLSAHPELAPGLIPLAPTLLALNKFEIAVSLQLMAGHETKFGLGARLLNLQYSRRYQVASESSSRIRITVEQYPVQVAV